MNRRVFVSGLAALTVATLAGCADVLNLPTATSAPPPTVPPSPTFLQANPAAATQTRAAEQTEVAALRATVGAPTATVSLLAASPISTRPAATATRSGSTTTATPGKAQVLAQNVSNYRDSIGTLWFIGEVVNTGSADAARVQVAVSLLGDTGQTVAAGSSEFVSPPVLPILKAGSKAVWRALVREAPAVWKEERIQVQSMPVDAFARDFYYYDVRVEGVSLAPPTNSSGLVMVSGQVVNTGAKGTRYVSITVAAYDGADKLLAIGSGSAKLDKIPAGGSAPFSFGIDQLKALPTKSDVYVFGQALPNN